MSIRYYAASDLSLRFIPIWRRNFMGWQKMAGLELDDMGFGSVLRKRQVASICFRTT